MRMSRRMGIYPRILEYMTLSETVAIGSTYRYQNETNAWKTVSKYGGGKNYVGKGSSDYNSAMIPFENGFSFKGKSLGIKAKMYLYVSDEDNHTFCWAITTSRANESKYQGYGAVTDSYQLAAGTFTPEFYSDEARHWQEITFECANIPADTPIYLYMWRNTTAYGNIHIEDDITVTFEYMG